MKVEKSRETRKDSSKRDNFYLLWAQDVFIKKTTRNAKDITTSIFANFHNNICYLKHTLKNCSLKCYNTMPRNIKKKEKGKKTSITIAFEIYN